MGMPVRLPGVNTGPIFGIPNATMPRSYEREGAGPRRPSSQLRWIRHAPTQAAEQTQEVGRERRRDREPASVADRMGHPQVPAVERRSTNLTVG